MKATLVLTLVFVSFFSQQVLAGEELVHNRNIVACQDLKPKYDLNLNIKGGSLSDHRNVAPGESDKSILIVTWVQVSPNDSVSIECGKNNDSVTITTTGSPVVVIHNNLRELEK